MAANSSIAQSTLWSRWHSHILERRVSQAPQAESDRERCIQKVDAVATIVIVGLAVSGICCLATSNVAPGATLIGAAGAVLIGWVVWCCRYENRRRSEDVLAGEATAEADRSFRALEEATPSTEVDMTDI